MILETQQSSDTTYRIYDYDRKDKDVNTRDLHLEQSKDVIDILNQDLTQNLLRNIETVRNLLNLYLMNSLLWKNGIYKVF